MKYSIWIMALVLCCAPHTGVGQERGAVKKNAQTAASRSFDLQQAQCIALMDNPSMAAAQERVEQARMRIDQAAAAWWPSVDVAAGAARQRLSDATHERNQAMASMMRGSADQTLEQYSTGIQATWLLFDGFYRHFKEEQALLGEQSEQASKKDGQRLLAASVAQAFLNAQLAQTNIDIAQANERFYIKQLNDAQNRYELGAGTWGDVLNIKVQINAAKTTRLTAERELEAAQYGLAALLGFPDAALPSRLKLQYLNQKGGAFQPMDKAQDLISEALAIRPDIQRLEMMAKQADAASGMAKSAMYPKVRLAGAVDGAKEGDPILGTEDFGNTVSVNMSWNLYAGGADQARMTEAWHARREVEHNLANLRNNVAAEIRQHLAMLTSAQEQVRLQQETVRLVEENRQLAQSEYEAGQAALVRLNEAQRDLTTTHGRLAQALVAYQSARQKLLAATGRNLQPFQTQPLRCGMEQ